MQDEEMLCSLTEQGNFGLGVGEIKNKKDQEQIRRLQEQQDQKTRKKKITNDLLYGDLNLYDND